MSTPKLFGCPLWLGKIKRRVAKKYLNRWILGDFVKKGHADLYTNLHVGDLVSDCVGQGKIINIKPIYKRKANGWILIDIKIQTSNAHCSFINCGIEPI